MTPDTRKAVMTLLEAARALLDAIENELPDPPLPEGWPHHQYEPVDYWPKYFDSLADQVAAYRRCKLCIWPEEHEVHQRLRDHHLFVTAEPWSHHCLLCGFDAKHGIHTPPEAPPSDPRGPTKHAEEFLDYRDRPHPFRPVGLETACVFCGKPQSAEMHVEYWRLHRAMEGPRPPTADRSHVFQFPEASASSQGCRVCQKPATHAIHGDTGE